MYLLEGPLKKTRDLDQMYLIEGSLLYLITATSTARIEFSGFDYSSEAKEFKIKTL